MSKHRDWTDWCEVSFVRETTGSQNIFNFRYAGMVLEANLDGNPFTFSGTGSKSATLTAGRHELKLKLGEQQINRLLLNVPNIARVKFPASMWRNNKGFVDIYRILEVSYTISEGIYWLPDTEPSGRFYGTTQTDWTIPIYQSTLYVTTRDALSGEMTHFKEIIVL